MGLLTASYRNSFTFYLFVIWHISRTLSPGGKATGACDKSEEWRFSGNIYCCSMHEAASSLSLDIIPAPKGPQDRIWSMSLYIHINAFLCIVPCSMPNDLSLTVVAKFPLDFNRTEFIFCHTGRFYNKRGMSLLLGNGTVNILAATNTDNNKKYIVITRR
jgi:hypothetical protein